MASEMRNALFISIVLVLLVVSFPIDADAQCSMCRAVVGSNVEGGESVRGLGLNNAILYIMAAPYLIMAVLAYVFWGHKLWGKKTAE